MLQSVAIPGVLNPKILGISPPRQKTVIVWPEILSWLMSLQTIRFRIRPDGRVEEQVQGLKGASCQKLTADLEDRLGSVISSAPTQDHYAPVVERQRQLQTTSLGQLS